MLNRLPAQDHPELRQGEVYIGDYHLPAYESLPWPARTGKDVYKLGEYFCQRYVPESLRLYPVFVQAHHLPQTLLDTLSR
jgi:hypothetical protein